MTDHSFNKGDLSYLGRVLPVALPHMPSVDRATFLLDVSMHVERIHTMIRRTNDRPSILLPRSKEMHAPTFGLREEVVESQAVKLS